MGKKRRRKIKEEGKEKRKVIRRFGNKTEEDEGEKKFRERIVRKTQKRN